MPGISRNGQDAAGGSFSIDKSENRAVGDR